METSRSKRENEQRVNERCYARLPIPFPLKNMRTRERETERETRDKGIRTTRRVGADPARPTLSFR
jgi:hypothetical protein